MNFDFRTIILLLTILLVGIVSSYTDTLNKKIKNKILLSGIIVGLIFNSSFFISEFYTNYFLNLLFALFIAFILWYVNFWSAGDGKLFFTFVSLLPLEIVFQNKFFLYSYNLIVYTFVPVFFVFLIWLFFQIGKKEFFHAFKEAFRIKTLANIFIAFFSFQWIIGLVNQSLNLKLNFFLSALILFVIFEGINRVLKINLIYLFYATAFLRLIIDFQNIFDWYWLFIFFSQLILFLIFVYFFIYIAYFKFGVHVKIPNLKKGMLLCEKIIKKGDSYTVEPDIKISLFMFLRETTSKKKPFIDIKAEGLTISEIQKLQELNKSGKMSIGSLLIQKRIPYAPFQFLGVIILIVSLIM